MPLILDKENGVDPMLSYCFYCGKEKNEILLTGINGKFIRRSAGVSQNTRGLCFNKKPCDECKSIMEEGVILISIKNEESGDNPYRTGGWCAVTIDAAKRIFKDVDIDKQRVFFLEDKIYDAIGLPRDVSIDNRKK